MRDRNILGTAIIILLLSAATAEAGYGLLQLIGIAASKHPPYPVTGSFYNPGPFGCYLSLTLPLAIAQFRYGQPTWLRYLSLPLLLLDALLLPASMSRTAWIAAFLGCLTVFGNRIIGNQKKWIVPLATISATVCVAMGFGLYSMKKDSADGRLLMWKVATKAVKHEPFSGSGPLYVAGTYGDSQEKYFASGQATEQEKMVADAPDYVFNEYLQTAIAYGWGVALILIFLFVAALIITIKQRNLPIAGCVVAAMTVMMASYPFQFPLSAITIALLLSAAFLSAKKRMTRTLGIALSISISFIIYSPTDRMELHRKFHIAQICNQSGKWEVSNRVLMEILPITSDPMPLNIIGKNYIGLNRPDSAEYYFRRAALRCPNRLYPHYLLMKLYADSVAPQKEKARNEALTILSMKVKVTSPASDSIRKEAAVLLQQL